MKRPANQPALTLFATGTGAASGISLTQTGIDRFTVQYGLQISKNLDYGRAARELGECVMHRLACESLIDNRTRAEARADGDLE